MTDNEPRPPRAPTPQGVQGAGPGNRHGLPPDDSPGWGARQDRPFHPEGGRPAADPEGEAAKLLARARTGPPAEGDAGPLGVAAERDGKDEPAR
jgi:hypothetical protein